MSTQYGDSGGHYYDREGKPTHKVEAANGSGLRPTNVRDARKMGLVPSVTTIFKLYGANGGLLQYLKKEYAVAAYQLGIDHVELSDYMGVDYFGEKALMKAVTPLAQKHANDAANAGSHIHWFLEQYQLEEEFECTDEEWNTCLNVDKLLIDVFGKCEWHLEKSFASNLGYGGAVDLSCLEGEGIIADYKTTTWGDRGPNIYPTHIEQLVAYAEGLGVPDARLANVFIHRETGEVLLIEHKRKKIEKARNCWRALLALWKAHNHDAGWKE